jgi:nicotinamide mononucleotide transporter
MENLIEFFISPYKNTPAIYIFIEFVAMAFGILSVYFSKKANILVYPTGIISTVLYVYLLSKWQMYGDLIINIYYTLMSIYGWWLWSRDVNPDTHQLNHISRCSKKDCIYTLIIFVFTSIFVIAVYKYYGVMPKGMGVKESFDYVWQHIKTGSLSQIRQITPYLDTFTTGAAFAAMWLMANKKLESWILWIIVNTASVPLYFIKGYGFTGIQYFIFLVMAFYGYKEWKQLMQKQKKQTA